MKGVCVLGSTGSIGISTLDVVGRHPERYRVVALTANRDAERLAAQCQLHRPALAVMVEARAATRLRALLADMVNPPEILAGPSALEEVAALPEVDIVMAAIVGAAGLLPTLAAARAGKRLLLANKEALVVAGAILMATAAASGATLLPIDSEHNAIFQCLPPGYPQGLERVGVERILLTASGGPFRDRPLAALAQVTPDQACAHPNWRMGPKISVDSATMMNKGLELIEACWLFGTRPERIQIVIHPQSVIHSLVQYVDGSVLAQLGNPDMRTPIAYALAYPERIDAGVQPLDLCQIGTLNFERPDLDRFPCLRLAYEALARGGNAPAMLNAANEVAVDAFLAGRLVFTRIPDLIERVLEAGAWRDVHSLEDVLAADAAAREAGRQYLAGRVQPA